MSDWLDPGEEDPLWINGRRDPRPLPPTNFSITNRETVGQNPSLSWTASATSGVSSYKIYRGSCDFTCNWDLIGSTSGTSYSDTEVLITSEQNAEDRPTYHITAIKSGYESEESNYDWVWGEYDIFPKQAVADQFRPGIPESFILYPNHPNPFNPSTEIQFTLPGAAWVSLVVSDVLGREMARLIDGRFEAGYHHITFDASNLPSGTYLYHLQAGSFSGSRTMILMK